MGLSRLSKLTASYELAAGIYNNNEQNLFSRQWQLGDAYSSTCGWHEHILILQHLAYRLLQHLSL